MDPKMMTPRRKITLTFFLFLSWFAGCERGPAAGGKTGHLKGDNFLLITLDTTRADRLGCYGCELASTPALDALALRGTLFERAYSQVPLTTPSHCSLFTGRYPREHGVRNNGRGSLNKSFPTLATVFKEHGYATGAFVSAFVLDGRYGLNHAFDVYDDRLGDGTLAMQNMSAHRTGDVVTGPVLKWLDSVKNERFFCWLHYYDPHDPYEPPPEFRESLAHPYDGEVAFMDSQIQRVMDWLEANQLTDRTLIVAVGDHGESFGEHGERGHTNFLYETNLHVPMIFAHPRVIPQDTRASLIVEIVGVFPTVLDLFGWSAPDGVSPRSFAGVFAGRELDQRVSYAESLYLRDLFGWAEQRSLTSDRWKYISSTKPELYDLHADPGEEHNLLSEAPDVAESLLADLKAIYGAMAPGKAGTVTMDEAARRRLETLGYLSGDGEVPEDFLTEGLADPKDKRAATVAMHSLRKLIKERKFTEALPKLEIVAERNPESSMVHFWLGICLKSLGRTEEAIVALRTAVLRSPKNSMALAELGNLLSDSGMLEDGAEHLLAALDIDPANTKAHAHLGETFRQLGRMDEALPHCRHVLSKLHPIVAEEYDELSILLADRGLSREAVELYALAISSSPLKPSVRFRFDLTRLRMGLTIPAADNLRQMIQAHPEMGSALIQAGVDRAQEGTSEQARNLFDVAVTIPPVAADGHYNLAVLDSRAEKFGQAVHHYESALDLQPAYEQALGQLTKIYIGSRRLDDAIRILDQAARAAPDNISLSISLAQILATCRKDELRDGAEALRLAQHACELTSRSNPAALLTLAAALAETGDFDKAVGAAREALDLLSAEEDDSLEQMIRTQLEGYLQGRPFRNPQF